MIIELAINLHPGELAQRDGAGTGGLVDRALDGAGGGFDVVESGQMRWSG
jgi:hypothetical protein